MKPFLFSVLILCSSIVFAQDRLSFVKDGEIKKEIQRSIEYLSKTEVIPKEIKENKVVFISFDFEDLVENPSLGIYYSTYIPTQYAKLDSKGQFSTSPNNYILHFNYSKKIVLVFNEGSRFFDVEYMKLMSNIVSIDKNDLLKSEYFQFKKGNEYSWDTVSNFITIDKIDGRFTPVRVNTFDLKTFVEVWYDVEVGEIPVANKKAEQSETLP